MKTKIFILWACFALAASPVFGGQAKTMKRTADVVIMKAAGFGPLLGKPIGNLRVYAMTPGGFVAIPFQFDERDAKGRMVFPQGPKAGKDEDNGALDANDELVFMIADAGAEASPSDFPGAWKNAVPVEINDPADQGKAWVYVLEYDSPPARAKDDYVRFDSATNTIYAKTYTMGFDKKAPIGIGYLACTAQGGGDGRNTMDRLKIRFSASTLGGMMKIDRNEEQFTCKVVAWIDGPVRVIRHTQNRMVLVLNIPTPSAMLDNVYYANQFEFPTEVNVPFDPATFISDPKFHVSTDALCGLSGMTYRNEKNPKPVMIDGVMSEEEKAFNKSAYDWMVVTLPTPNKGAWMNRLTYDKSLGVYPELYYVDDRKALDQPENEPGQCGNLGYYLAGMIKMKKGALRLNSIMYNIPSFDSERIPEYLKILNKPLTAKPGSAMTR